MRGPSQVGASSTGVCEASSSSGASPSAQQFVHHQPVAGAMSSEDDSRLKEGKVDSYLSSRKMEERTGPLILAELWEAGNPEKSGQMGDRSGSIPGVVNSRSGDAQIDVDEFCGNVMSVEAREGGDGLSCENGVNTESSPVESQREKDASCVLIQAPDDVFYIGQETTSSGTDRDDTKLNNPLVFAPATRGTCPGLAANHIPVPSSGTSMAGQPAGNVIFNPYDSPLYIRRKRCFVFLLLLGSILYLISFVSAVVRHANGEEEHGEGSGLTYMAHSMITSDDIPHALAYLMMYLALDMIGLTGALLDNGHLILVYVIAEGVVLTAYVIRARDKVQASIVFHLVVLMLAVQVRKSINQIRLAEQQMLLQLSEGQQSLPRGGGLFVSWNRNIRWRVVGDLQDDRLLRVLEGRRQRLQGGGQANAGGGGRNIPQPRRAPHMLIASRLFSRGTR